MYISPHLKVIKSTKGKAVVAAIPIERDELVCELFFDSVGRAEDQTSVQIWQDIFLHNSLKTIDDLFNHSCDPTTYLKHPQREFRALRDIAVDDEITWNYCTTESDLVKSKQDFICHCGSPSCLGHIQGFKYLSKKQKRELWGYLSPYLKTI